MNYYFPIHKAIVSKDKYMHVYWYVTLTLSSVILIIMLYLALSDRKAVVNCLGTYIKAQDNQI